ncbi:hypothetical protein BDA99DRAFT_522687 [Phascolomyces articulosus]|uniref:Uncharacterized protein n=1 Tax=Phascolomyces articulosus TaxID=60185 RepID=A0AAD5K4I5_9FUNG|nr:hypothetical protein BDA99DRAFT_522687 [Phascolomyces articulosus]
MSREIRYVCHRAANAIITEVDPLRVSTDALQVINQFLDEFVHLLLSSSQSLDLSRIKTTVLSLLLSSAVGKNAIVEAELQVKSYSESTDTIDYEAYERTRTLDPSLLPKLVDRLREDIVNYCTLAEKNHQNPRRPSLASTISTTNTVNNIAISPIVIVYVTAIIEHVAEYILTAIAMTAEHQDTEYIRVKEVYITLMDDIQVGNMFSKMALRERLEKRASVLNYRSSQQQQQNILPSPVPSPVTSSRKQSNVHIRDSTVDPYMDIGFVDDEEMDYSQPGSPPPNGKIPSMYSMTQARPMSIMSTSTSTNTISSTTSSGSKKGFRLFGKKRDSVATDTSSPQSPVRQHHHHHNSYQPSIQQQQQQRASKTPVAVSVYHSDSPAINFEDLIKSGDTVRLSLTPSRLKSIEIMKDHSGIDESTSIRSTDSDSFIATKQQPPLPPPHQQQIRPTSMDRSITPAIHHNHTNNISSFTTRRAVSSDLPASQFQQQQQQQQQLQQRHSHQVLHKKLSLDEPVTPFENPRSAPKPPILRSIAPGTRTSFVEPDHPPRRTPRRQQTKEELERPSSMVAKRASMISSARPTSFHENFALQYVDGEEPPSQQQSSPLSVSTTTMTKTNGAVREKVLKFELAKSEQSVTTQTSKPIYLEAGVQTDPELPRVIITAEDCSSERGIVVGDEEWFVPDEDWEEDEHEQEHTIVEWLLGE